MEWVWALSGLLVGLLLGLSFAKRFIDERDRLQSIRHELEVELAKKSEQLSLNKEHAKERIKELESIEEKMAKEFKAITQELYEKKALDFQKNHTATLETILKPFKEQIADFEKKVGETYIQEAKERAVLGGELQKLRQLNMKMQEDAINLTKALKGENKTQGNWGELVLERILEESGLRKGTEYEVQSALKDSEGRRYQPDVLVHLPDRKDIIIDSKVSLVAYERYMSAEDEQERQLALKAHLQSIQKHIDELSAKSYEDLIGVNSLDFVLLFLPIEGAFLLALEHDGSFFAKAFERNIMVVSPSTLLVTLRTIENIWRYEHQSQNALLIAQKAGDLYDKFHGFVSDMEKIGNSIRKSEEQYQSAFAKLATGRGNLITRVETLKELGVKAKKELDAIPAAKEALSYTKES